MVKVDKPFRGMGLPGKTHPPASRGVKAGGNIEDNKLPTQSLFSNDSRQQELLARMNQADTASNRLILQYLLAIKLELTPEIFAQTELSLSLLNRQLNITAPDNKAVLAVILALKLGLADSPDALKAIYSYLTEAPKILEILDRMAANIHKLKSANDFRLDEILKHSEFVKLQLNLNNNPTQLNKLVNTMLLSPEALLAGHGEKETAANRSLILQMDKLIAMMQDADIEKDLSSLIKEATLLKQIFVGNILLHNEEALGNQVMIPFYFQNHRCQINIKRKKQKAKRFQEDMRIEIKIDHHKLGSICFMLTIAEKNVSSEILLVNERAKQIVEANIFILQKKLFGLGFNLNIVKIDVINEEMQDALVNDNLIDIAKISFLDIKV